jgi:hypothetical protein
MHRFQAFENRKKVMNLLTYLLIFITSFDCRRSPGGCLDTMPKTGEHLLDLYFLRRVDICGLDVPIVS